MDAQNDGLDMVTPFKFWTFLVSMLIFCGAHAFRFVCNRGTGLCNRVLYVDMFSSDWCRFQCPSYVMNILCTYTIYILDRYLLQHQKTKITPDKKCGWKTTIPFEMVPYQRHVLIFRGGKVFFVRCMRTETVGGRQLDLHFRW